MKNPIKKIIHSWFLFAWGFALGIKRERDGRRYNTEALLTFWMARILFILLFVFSKNIFDLVGWYKTVQGGSTENFRSLSNPISQIMIGLFAFGWVVVYAGARHIKTPDTSKEKPSGKQFLGLAFLLLWIIFVPLLLLTHLHFLVLIDIAMLVYFYFKKDEPSKSESEEKDRKTAGHPPNQ